VSAPGSCLTVGVLFPERFHTDHASFAAALDRLRDAHPSVAVEVAAYEDSSERRTRRSRPDFVRRADDVDELSEHQREVWSRMDVALALDLPFDVIALAPRLRWVQAAGAGVGQLLSVGLPTPSIRLSSAAGTSAPEIAEFVMARVLEHAKHLRELDGLQRECSWRPLYGRVVGDLTIGLVGLGAINLAVARLASAFGMQVLGVRRRPGAPPIYVDEVVAMSSLHEVLERSDVVVAALPETAETVGCFDVAAFAAMRPGSLFCNVGRGSAVDDAALHAALARGAPAAAALDVFPSEPLPDDDPAWRHPAVHVSAHCSSVPARSIERVHDLFRTNLTRFVAGEPLVNEVAPPSSRAVG
jgi:phosphoglycerate dehydrogenase-like enzyme